jgi:hypothetical protein
MGGKGGGGGPSYQDSLNQVTTDPGLSSYWKGRFEDSKRGFDSEADWYANYGIPKDPNRPAGSENQFTKDMFTKFYGSYRPPAPAPAPAPAAAAPAPGAPAPAAPAPVVPDTPAVPETGTGNPIEQPTSLGNDLASTVGGQNFWVGGIDSTKNTKSGAGSLKTTQT